MTEQEIIKVLGLLETAYGQKRFYADTDKKSVVYLWSVMFREDEAVEVNRAVVNCISTLQFPPTIADIKTRLAEARMAGQMTEMEAWGLVSEAVNNANGRKEAQEAFDQLPAILRKVVSKPEQLRAWRKVSDESFETVVASNVIRSYRELAKREAGYYALPIQVRDKEAWMIEAPTYEALPAPEETPKLEGEAYREAQGLQVQTSQEKLDAFLRPVTEGDIKALQFREQQKFERIFK